MDQDMWSTLEHTNVNDQCQEFMQAVVGWLLK
jgi:hypothetical protein